MNPWLQYQNYKLIEKGLRERLEMAKFGWQIMFILSAIMDAREAQLQE